MSAQRGDGFDDDFVPDDLVADSPEEEVEIASSTEDDEDSPPATGHTSAGQSQVFSEDRAKAKKRKRREKEKDKKVNKRRLVEALESNEPVSIAAQPPSLQAEYLAKKQAKSYSKLSSVELDDMRIPENAIVDTSAWTAPRTLDQLPDFVTKMVPTLKTRLAQKSKDNGAPTLLFISGAALRVADATRVLKSKTLRGDKGGDVAKLFARHFKLEEHVAYLKRAKIGSAVGTPGRIGKLLCEGALSTSALTHIILDVTYKDAKKRSMLDIPETRDEIFRSVLGAESVRQGIQRQRIQIVLF
ncbi:CMS1 [Sanghuangporus sanghuang]